MENNLKHHGVVGMKWGVRRTPKQLGHNPKRGSSKKRTLDEVSDDELKRRIARLDLEKRYKDLSSSVNPPKSTRGRDFTLRVIERIGENALVNIGSQALTKGLGLAINKAFGVDSYDSKFRVVNPNKGQSDKK